MSNGLGDTISGVAHFLSIDKVADAVAKLAGLSGCGCEERKRYLNILFPYDSYNRMFHVLRDFNFNGTEYKVGDQVIVTKTHPLFNALIPFVRDGLIKEE